MQRIVIVGGGAGGPTLATQLRKRLGKKDLAEITRTALISLSEMLDRRHRPRIKLH